MDHLFLEFLTDGDEISDVAAIRTTADRTVRGTFTEKILTKTFADGVSLPVAITSLKEKLLPPSWPASLVLVSYKSSPLVQTHVSPLFADHGHVFLNQLGWPLVWARIATSLDLEALATAHGLKAESLDSASGRAFTVMITYWAMMRRYKTGLGAEEAMTAFGGEALKEVRRWMNF